MTGDEVAAKELGEGAAHGSIQFIVKKKNANFGNQEKHFLRIPCNRIRSDSDSGW
jgi:hypothetical protein